MQGLYGIQALLGSTSGALTRADIDIRICRNPWFLESFLSWALEPECRILTVIPYHTILYHTRRNHTMYYVNVVFGDPKTGQTDGKRPQTRMAISTGLDSLNEALRVHDTDTSYCRLYSLIVYSIYYILYTILYTIYYTIKEGRLQLMTCL